MNAPAIAVLLTQVIAVAWFCLLGAFAGSIARRHVGPLAAVRVSLWVGLAVATVAILVIGLFTPTRGGTAVAWAVLVTALAVVVWVVVRWRRGRTEDDERAFTRSWWVLVPIGALALFAFAVAHLTFGPVVNYDTGLYHLNAIQYAADYPTIPGLANLHTRLGTNNSAFDLAAFLGNTAWAADAFRLLVGVYLLVLSIDLGLRLLDGRAAAWRRPGTYLMIVALAVSVPGLLQVPQDNVSSPSPDTIALVLALAAGAYLVDALQTRDRTWLAVALVTATLAASVRAQLWVMVAMTVLVLIIDAWLRRRAAASIGPRSLVVVGGVVAGLTGIVTLIRDAVLSGWLLFPMTYLPIPVDWQVPRASAESTRDWVMSWARDQSAGPDQTLTSWYWFPAWIRETAAEWSIAGMIGLLTLALVVWLAVRRTGAAESTDARDPRGRTVLLLALLPALTTVAVWFFTAPDPRFAWGPLLLVGAIPAAFALQRIAGSGEGWSPVPVVVGGLLCLAVVPATVTQVAAIRGEPGGTPEIHVYSFGPIDVVASVSKLPVPPTREFVLVDGTVVRIPTESDQCYEVFPLCTPYENGTLRLRGSEISEGFRSD